MLLIFFASGWFDENGELFRKRSQCPAVSLEGTESIASEITCPSTTKTSDALLDALDGAQSDMIFAHIRASTYGNREVEVCRTCGLTQNESDNYFLEFAPIFVSRRFPLDA